MINVEFKINNSKYQIECPENEEEKVLKLAKKIDDRSKKLAAHFKNADEKTILAICCLMMEDEIDGANKPAQEKFDFEANIEKISRKIDLVAKKIESQ